MAQSINQHQHIRGESGRWHIALSVGQRVISLCGHVNVSEQAVDLGKRPTRIGGNLTCEKCRSMLAEIELVEFVEQL